MSNQGPVDPFTRRSRIRELASTIERLAECYSQALEPVRNALNAILRAKPDQWLEQLYGVQPHVRGLVLTESRYGEIDTTRITSPRSLARHTLIRLGDAVARNDRTRFAELSDQVLTDPAVVDETRVALPEFARVIMSHAYMPIRPLFVALAQVACENAEVQFGEGLEQDLAKAGVPPSPRAADAVRHWLYPYSTPVKFTSDGQIAPLGWRESMPKCEDDGSGDGPYEESGEIGIRWGGYKVICEESERRAREIISLMWPPQNGKEVTVADVKRKLKSKAINDKWGTNTAGAVRIIIARVKMCFSVNWIRENSQMVEVFRWERTS